MADGNDLREQADEAETRAAEDAERLRKAAEDANQAEASAKDAESKRS